MWECVKTHWFGPIYVKEWRYLDTEEVTFALGGLFFPTLDAAQEEIRKVYGFVPA